MPDMVKPVAGKPWAAKPDIRRPDVARSGGANLGKRKPGSWKQVAGNATDDKAAGAIEPDDEVKVAGINEEPRVGKADMMGFQIWGNPWKF